MNQLIPPPPNPRPLRRPWGAGSAPPTLWGPPDALESGTSAGRVPPRRTCACRSLEDYDIQTYNTTGRHVVLQARFEDQEFALKEYVISDLEVLKHEVCAGAVPPCPREAVRRPSLFRSPLYSSPPSPLRLPWCALH